MPFFPGFAVSFKNLSVSRKIRLLSFFFSLLSLTALLIISSAQSVPAVAVSETKIGIASTYALADEQAEDGDIICFSEETASLMRCHKPYDEKMFGVLTTEPQVVLRGGSDEKPLSRDGKAGVKVNGQGGPIEVGDYITTSTVPGEGQKATEPTGWVIGRALTPFDGNGSGRITVALSLGPAIILSRANLLDQLGLLLIKNVQKPEGAALFVRYVTAGLVTLFVTFFAFNNFGHNITKGVEAVGRNPLAKNQIQFIVVINVILVALVALGGVLLSLAIIRI